MKDYAWKDRQQLIHGPDAPVQMYRRLIKDGFSESAAQQLSGYHPIDEFDACMRRFTWAGVIFGVVAFLFLFATTPRAAPATPARPDPIDMDEDELEM